MPPKECKITDITGVYFETPDGEKIKLESIGNVELNYEPEDSEDYSKIFSEPVIGTFHVKKAKLFKTVMCRVACWDRPKLYKNSVRISHRPDKGISGIVIMDKDEHIVRILKNHDYYFTDKLTIRFTKRMLPIIADNNILVMYFRKVKAFAFETKPSDWRKNDR